MRSRVLVTGMSGTGKSTVLSVLGERGHRVVDTDTDEWCRWVTLPDGSADWIWREDAMAPAPASTPSSPRVAELPDFVRAPNQADDPALYETENAAIDPEGVLAAALWSAAPWDDRDVLDLGCGSGYWLPTYADRARSVTGVEPDPTLLPLAGARSPTARVLRGSAEHIPLPDGSVDVVHARFAYFFPPGCDAGLAEVLRVLRPGGALVVIDNDHRWGEFAELLASSPWASPQGEAETKDAWWAERGAARQEVRSSWRFPDRAALDAVLRLEFPPALATTWLRDHPDRLGLSYGYVLFTVPEH